MKTFRYALTGAIACLALAGCGKRDSSTVTAMTTVNSAESPPAAVPAGIRPGMWEGTTTVGEMKTPDLPPEQQAKMASLLAERRKPTPFVSCVTPNQIKANRQFFTGYGDLYKTCTFNHFTMADGKVDAAMTCDSAGRRISEKITGTYTAESYAISVTTDAASLISTAAAPLSTKVAITAKRIGDCGD